MSTAYVGVQHGDLTANPTRAGVLNLTRQLARPHRWPLASALAINVISSASTVAVPVLIGRVTDALLAGDRRAVMIMCGLLSVATVGRVITAAVGRRRLARTGEHLVRDLRERVVDRLSATPLRFLERHRHGELLQRGTAEIAALSSFVRDALTEIVVTISTVVIMVAALLVESWLLTAVALVAFLPAGVMLMRSFQRVAPAAYAADSAAEADLTARLAEMIRVRSVLVGAPPAGKEHWSASLGELNRAAESAQRRTAVIAVRIHALVVVQLVTLAVMAVVGSWLVGRGTVTVGVVVTFVLAGRILFAGFADLAEIVADVEEAATGMARTQDLLRTMDLRTPASVQGGPVQDGPVQDQPEQDGPVQDGPVQDEPGASSGGVLEVRDLSFGYGGPPVLAGLSATFPAGARVGLAGRSGAGKSTLVKLLAGLYTPDAGRVIFDGLDVSALTGRERARCVTLVPQQVQLGSGAIRDELLLAAPAATDAALTRAGESVGLGVWLAGLPDGLDTSCAALSAGERQLIGLIRVALIDAHVLILDEATSDIDPVTAALVESALDLLSTGRTVIVVAHRPETLARLPIIYEVRSDRLVPVATSFGC